MKKILAIALVLAFMYAVYYGVKQENKWYESHSYMQVYGSGE